MRILLINPPRSKYNGILQYASETAKKFIHKKLIGPPLGLLTIAAACADEEVTFLDMKGEYDLDPNAPPPEVLVTKYLEMSNPDIVGTTFIASEFNSGLEIFKTAKKFNPNILTVAGGLHTTLCPGDFADESVDVLCPGQSARAFLEIIEAKKKNISLEKVKGIIINKNGKQYFTEKDTRSWNPAKENFIAPDRKLLKRWLSTYKVGGSPHILTYLFTSLGCPYKCSFCSIWPQFCGRFYQREIESVVEELKTLNDYKIVRFADANTIVNIDFIDKLFDRIIEEGIYKEYVMDIRADTAAENPKLIEKLARAGLKVVICGFESYKDEELKKYNKDAQAVKIEESIKVFHNNGISVRGNYVIPNDYTERDFDEMKKFASKRKVVYAGYTILTPMPGTPYYEEVKNDIVDFDLAKYNFFNCVLKTKIPLEKFYENVGELWLIKEGTDVI